jgi:cobalt-zinc-cadmium efflux system protein
MTHGHGLAHSGASATARHAGRLGTVLGLTLGFFVLELAASFWTGSLALLADAGHMLTDAAGLALALFAAWIGTRPPTPTKTYGYYRAEILATLANAVVLLGIAGFVVWEAYQRFLAPRPVLAAPMLAVALLGLAANLTGMALLHAGARESLNVRGAYLEVLSDAFGSLGVIAAAVAVLLTGWTPADPLIAGIVGLFILPRTWRLLSQAVHILLEGVPSHVQLDELEAAMREVEGVREVHDLHVWTLTSGRYAMSAHVGVDTMLRGDRAIQELHTLLHDRFGVEHTTIQLESRPLLQIDVPAGREATASADASSPSAGPRGPLSEQEEAARSHTPASPGDRT